MPCTIQSRSNDAVRAGGMAVIWLMSAALRAEPAFGDDWPQWRGPNRDGISHVTTAFSFLLPMTRGRPWWS